MICVAGCTSQTALDSKGILDPYHDLPLGSHNCLGWQTSHNFSLLLGSIFYVRGLYLSRVVCSLSQCLTSYEDTIVWIFAQGWLQVHNIRKAMVDILREKFKDLNLTFSIGGQISFDVSLPVT
jgi:hypothetical protein